MNSNSIELMENNFHFSHLRAEHNLILSILQFMHIDKKRIIDLLQMKLDWVEILGFLTFNRVAGLAFHVFDQFNKKHLCGQAMFSMSSIYEAQSIRTINNRKYIKLISEKLTKNKIPHAFLKGSFLANIIYPIGCRTSNDIDILINPKDITKCSKELEALGYIQGYYDSKKDNVIKADRKEIVFRRMNWGETFPFIKVVKEQCLKYIIVDINFSLDWLPTGTEYAVNCLLTNAKNYTIEDNDLISTLDKESFLIHLCMHLYKEAILYDTVIYNNDLDLYKFVDIYAYIYAVDVNWEEFIQKVNKFRLSDGCYFALEYARAIFPLLNSNKNFLLTLNKIKPTNTRYLYEVIDPSRPNINYVWQEDILSRLFDMKRCEKLKEMEV